MESLRINLDVVYLQLSNLEINIQSKNLSNNKKELLASILVDMKRQAKTLKHILER